MNHVLLGPYKLTNSRYLQYKTILHYCSIQLQKFSLGDPSLVFTGTLSKENTGNTNLSLKNQNIFKVCIVYGTHQACLCCRQGPTALQWGRVWWRSRCPPSHHRIFRYQQSQKKPSVVVFLEDSSLKTHSHSHWSKNTASG